MRKCHSILLILVMVTFLSPSISMGSIQSLQVGEEPGEVAVNNTTSIAVVANEDDGSVSIIDLTTPTVVTTITVGKKPIGVAINEQTNQAVIVNKKDNTVSVIDLAIKTVIATINVSRDPKSVAINQLTNKAYVSNHKDDSISVINLNTQTVIASIPTGRDPLGIAIYETANKAIVACEKDARIQIFNLDTNSLISSIQVGNNPSGLAIDNATGNVLVANEKDNTISVVNISTNTVIATIPVSKDPEKIAINSDTALALVTSSKEDHVSIIDLSANTVIGQISSGEDPSGVAVSRTNNIAVISNSDENSISIIDLSNIPYTFTTPTGEKPQGLDINPSNNIAVVANEKSDNVSIIDIANSTVINTVDVDKKPVAVSIDSETNRAYVANKKSNTLTVIDISSGTVIATVQIGKDPVAVAVNTKTNRVLVANKKDNNISVIDLNTNTLISQIDVGKSPYGIAIDSNINRAVVANKKDDTISIIDLATENVLFTVGVGKNPVDIKVNEITHIAAVTNKKDDTVSIIDINSGVLLATVPVGNDPDGIAINSRTNQALIANHDDENISVIDLSTYSVIDTLYIGTELSKIAVNRTNNIAVLTDEDNDGVTIVHLSGQDVVPPVVTITSHQDGQAVSASPIIISGTVDDSQAEIYAGTIQALVVNNTFTIEGIELVDGANQVTLTANDIAGNNSAVSISIILDSNPPVPDIDPLSVVTGECSATVASTPTATDAVAGPITGATTDPLTYTTQGMYSITWTYDDGNGNISSQIQTVIVDDTTTPIADLSTIPLIEGEGSVTVSTTPTATDNCIGAVTGTTIDNLTYSIVGDHIINWSYDDGNGNVSTQQQTVRVTGIVQAAVSISAAPTSILLGESTTLTWNSTGVLNAYIDNVIGEVGLSGSIAVYPTETTTYTIMVNGNSGLANAEVTVHVLGNPEPQPEGTFGNIYSDQIPSDATLQSYDTDRFSVITGFVQDRMGNSLAGVMVSLHDRPEYGTVETDIDGNFSIPTDGGGTVTMVYEKSGYILSHRKVQVGWNEITIAPVIVMLTEDPVSTTVNFDGNPATVFTHSSSVITDADGSRSMSMVFTGDNRVFASDGNGGEIELGTITTRATEFETPESMPAILPPNSAYTYASDLTVDGADNVRFEKPVVTYVNNFLGFNVGEIVPVGYYDRERAVWVPSDNGVVVRLLDTDLDGTVDALDSTGDGQPDDLNNDGSYNDDVVGLEDYTQYQPNDTYWRVEVSHFTPWDYNWPYGPPADAVLPTPNGEPSQSEQLSYDDKNCMNSYVESRSQIFHEDIPVSGTGLTLHYASNRVEGYQSIINVPASGESVPESLKSIIVKMKIAGVEYETILDPLPNQSTEFIWDGRDNLGRSVVGSRSASISVGFVYDALYYSAASSLGRAFGLSGDSITMIRSRQEAIKWKHSAMIVHRAAHTSTISEGWSISPHNYIEISKPGVLFRGDGAIVRNSIATISSLSASFNVPTGIAMDNEGNIYVSDYPHFMIKKIDSEGIVTRVAGNGIRAFYGDGGPAIDASIEGPNGLVVDSNGNIYIADTGNNRIRKVDTSGVITTVAGNGDTIYNGDDILATAAALYAPYDVTVDNLGNLYVAETHNNRVRKVDTGGIITTVAGNGTAGYSGDGGPAVDAELSMPISVAVDSEGNLYISDYNNNRIRKVDTSGVITTVAGNGNYFYSGDGGPATAASFNPYGVAVNETGNIFIVDYDNSRIRVVDSKGIIRTIAGNGQRGVGGNGGPPTLAELYYPRDLVLSKSGGMEMYISDTFNHVIREVTSPISSADFLVSGELLFVDENGLGYMFDSTGLHMSTKDLTTDTDLLTFGYDTARQLISITDRFGNSTTISRDAQGTPVSITSADGIVTSLTMDLNNHLTYVTYPDSSFYSFSYTANGLMTDEFDPRGNQFEHFFDINGRVTDILDPEGGSWNYTSGTDPLGNTLVSMTTAEGNLTTYEDHTDSTGILTSISTEPSGATTTMVRAAEGLNETRDLSCGTTVDLTYDLDPEYQNKYIKDSIVSSPAGLSMLTAIGKTYSDTDSDGVADLITNTSTINGQQWATTNNVLTGLISSTSPLGRVATTNYDPSTLLTQQVSTTGLLPTSFTYDIRGRMTDTTTGARTTTFAYDANGKPDYMITPDNQTYDYTYDIMGRLSNELRPDGTTIQYSYDANGNMTVLVNPFMTSHTFASTANDQKESYNTPLSGSYLYSYDKERKLKTLTFPSGGIITNTYTNGLLTSTLTPEGTTAFAYGCNNKITNVTRGAESLSYAYDGSLLTSVTGAGSLNQSLGFTYDNNFRLSSMTYAGVTNSLGYDNDGLLTSAGGFTITRNAGNGLPEVLSDGTLTNARTFNGYGEIDGYGSIVNSVSAHSLTVTRDLAGRITQKTEDVEGISSIYDYTYDTMGRLLTVTKNSVLVEEYQYDTNGARTYEMNSLRGIAGRTLSYSDEDHLLTAGSTTYQHDLDGFLTTKTEGANVTVYDYSSRGELLSVTLPDGRFIQYIQDSLGRRIAKIVNGVVTEKYLWSGTIQLLAVYDGTDNLVSRFTYADGRMPMAMTKGGTTYYLSYDQVGSLRLVTDVAGNVVKTIEYDSFGNVIADSNPSFSVPFGFAGGLHDADTGLVRFGYRDYDPDTGRWTAKDPIFFAGGDIDLYGYVLNDPVNLLDPFGLLSYLVSRPLSGSAGSIASHNFIVTNANYLGDPNATIYSYGINSEGMVGRVDNNTTGFSAGTHRTDIAGWNALRGQGGSCGNTSQDVSQINASDFLVDAYANSLIENQDYAAFAGLFGANSNSAAQAIANRAARQLVSTPGAGRVSPGSGSWIAIRFGMTVISAP